MRRRRFKINFNLTENVTADLMHDVLEGTCMYIMSSLIHTFVFVKQYFILETLNMRIENFDFGPTSNKPPQITMSRILNNVTLKMSASEMLTFVRYFGLIVGDLIPEDDTHWKLYSYLRQIIDILLSPRVILADAKILKKLIQDQNELYQKLYGKLKPKFHLLVHYPRILINNGPIFNFWGMHFESNHRPLKCTAQSTSCTKNLLKTIATKQTLIMCEMMHSLEFEKTIKFGAVDNSNKLRSYFSNEKQNKLCKYFNQCDIYGIPYQIGTYIVTDMKDSEIEFGETADIICLEN